MRIGEMDGPRKTLEDWMELCISVQERLEQKARAKAAMKRRQWQRKKTNKEGGGNHEATDSQIGKPDKTERGTDAHNHNQDGR